LGRQFIQQGHNLEKHKFYEIALVKHIKFYGIIKIINILK
jgi:hypothetical protein